MGKMTSRALHFSRYSAAKIMGKEVELGSGFHRWGGYTLYYFFLQKTNGIIAIPSPQKRNTEKDTLQTR